MDLRQEDANGRRSRLRPAAGDVERLVRDLHDGTPTQRDAAVARLRVIGPRAFSHLSSLIGSPAPPAGRAAALSVLEGQDDPRAVALAATALLDPDAEVAVAAAGVLRAWLTEEQGTHALDALTTVALDKQRDARVRLAALDALSELPRHLVAPILERAPLDEPDGPATDDPLALRTWLAEHETTAPFSVLHGVVSRAVEQERTDALPGRQDAWRGVRGAAHAALARRGSRVAVYDLREAFDTSTRPLPVDFLTAVALVGDASCLEPMARAWAATTSEPWWRGRLLEAAADIVRRLKLGSRHASVKRVRAKWPGFL